MTPAPIPFDAYRASALAAGELTLLNLSESEFRAVCCARHIEMLLSLLLSYCHENITANSQTHYDMYNSCFRGKVHSAASQLAAFAGSFQDDKKKILRASMQVLRTVVDPAIDQCDFGRQVMTAVMAAMVLRQTVESKMLPCDSDCKFRDHSNYVSEDNFARSLLLFPPCLEQQVSTLSEFVEKLVKITKY